MPHINFFFHTVVATKRRAKVIRPEFDDLIRHAVAEAATEFRAELVAFGAWWDHAHFVHSIDPSTVFFRMIGCAKSRATRALRDAGLENYSWQTGYWSETVSPRSIHRVVAYVENQRDRHAADLDGM
jgi:REP element-mobilizing transposase RayT